MRLVDWEARPAIISLNREAFSYLPHRGGWVQVSDWEVTDSGEWVSAAVFATRFPNLPEFPISEPVEDPPQTTWGSLRP